MRPENHGLLLSGRPGLDWSLLRAVLTMICITITNNRLHIFLSGSDLFFDPEVFEPLLITISWLLEHNPKAEVLIAVQERSSDWSLEEYLIKWKLKCAYIYPKDFLQGTGLEESDLTGKHTIFILKIFRE